MGTIDLNDLATFAAIADAGGVSTAAKKLRVPKSSVSRALARLEAELGVELVHRTTRRVALSTAGAALHERVRPLLASLEEAALALPEREELPSGTLRVTMPVDFASTVLGDVAVRFAARYPGVDLDIHVSNTFVDIVGEGFDAAVRITNRRLEDSSLLGTVVGAVSLQLFASPRYLARAPAFRTPKDAVEHQWVMQSGRKSIELRSGETTRTIPVRGRIQCDDMFFIRAALKAGGGVGVLPAYLAEADVASGDLARVLPKWAAPSGKVWVVHPSVKNVSAKVTAFKAFVADALRARPLG